MERRPDTPKTKRIFVVAPDGQAGGGMGRVKDYIVEAGRDYDDLYTIVPVVTRDARGPAASLWLLARAMLTIGWARLRGTAALVHVNFGDRGSAFRKGTITLFSRCIGVPVLLHLHAVELQRQYGAAGPLIRWLIRQPFEWATVVVVLGDRWRRWLTSTLAISDAKVELLWNGVPVPPHRLRNFPTNPDHANLLFLGNLLERKGVSDLLSALAAMPPTRRAWRVTFAGGGLVDQYRAAASELDIGERVEFLGWVDQSTARSLLAETDILVLPSYEEGLPLVILEALGMGTPVVCTPVGAIGEVLSDGQTAVFCEPGDRATLSQAMATLIDSPDFCAQLSRRGVALYDRLFSLRAFQSALFDIYARRLKIHYAPTSEQAE